MQVVAVPDPGAPERRAARRKGKGPKASATQLVRGSVSRAVLARESQVGVSQAGTYTIKVEKDKPSPVLRLDGVGTAPAIRVSGPGGVLEAPAGKGFVKTPDNKMRIMRYQGQLAKITSIGFQKADPGTYTVQVLPGSSPVVAVRQATDPPAAKVKGKVTGKERNRVFSYEVARRPSQKVVFSEVTASGASQVIGSTAGGKGRIRFRSAPGGGRRTILAQFSLDGINAERKRVTTFKPQSPVMARPKGVKLSRKGARLRVSWKRVTGATAYEVAVTPASRRMVFARTRGRRASLKVPGWDSGRVTVRASTTCARARRRPPLQGRGQAPQRLPVLPPLQGLQEEDQLRQVEDQGAGQVQGEGQGQEEGPQEPLAESASLVPSSASARRRRAPAPESPSLA